LLDERRIEGTSGPRSAFFLIDTPTRISGVTTAAFLGEDGELAGRIRAFDWAATSLGPIDDWPATLKTAVGIAVRSSVPMVVLWGPDGVMIYNDGYSVFAGKRHPQLLGSKVREGWAEVSDFNDHMMRVVLSGGTLAYKDQELTLFRHGRAEQVWMNLDYSPIVDENGHPVGVIAIVVDRSEAVLNGRRLEAERDQLAQMFEQAPTFMALLQGPEHHIVLANPGYQRLVGQSDILGRTVRSVVAGMGDQGYLAVLDQVYRSGETYTGRSAPFVVRPGPGDAEIERVLDFVYQPLQDSHGRVTGIFVEGVDVTERALSEIALRESEARLRELNANLERQVLERTQARGKTWRLLPDLLGALNSQGYFETSNPAWKTVLGWSEDEVACMSIFDLLHPDDVESTRRGFEAIDENTPAIRFPNRYRCKDGSYRWISWVGVQEDQLIYCIGRDITEDRLAQDELATAQEALRQSQKMEAIGQLTGGIAHDFNNLLGGIGGSLEMLQKRIAEGRLHGVQRFIDAAQTSTNRAALLTQRLLAFSRRQTLDPKPTDVNRLVAGMADLIRRTIGPQIDLEVVGAGGLWPTLVDASQLESALLNLVINARDAMPGGGRITIETANKWLDQIASSERELAPGQYISLCVTDTGTGMTQEVRSRAFDPFFTTKPIGQGTGLGLSMIHGFVRQSGGQVRIYSEIGMGTTMCLYLPRYTGDIDTTDVTDVQDEASITHGETVLVIDDEESIRMVVTMVLQEAGYRVLEAADGPAGLRILQSDARIDLLITDIGLPGGLNGRQVAEAARGLRPELRILFATGYAENSVFGNGHLAAGMEVITKPFTMAALTSRVRAMIDAH
jgi:PAS domain S-box-containing protein